MSGFRKSGHIYQGGTGKFIYKDSILDNKQLTPNTIDHKALQVPYTTTIAFLADSYSTYFAQTTQPFFALLL